MTDEESSFGHSMILSQLGKIERASATTVHWCAQEVTTDLQGELKVWDVFHIEIKLYLQVGGEDLLGPSFFLDHINQ